jgi:hypothetical protein
MPTEDGSLQWVARAVCLETVKYGSVRGPGCDSPDLLGNSPDLVGRGNKIGALLSLLAASLGEGRIIEVKFRPLR